MSSNPSSSLHRLAIVAALALAVAGTIHLVDAPDMFGDATYLGLSFLGNFALAIVAAAGILIGSRIAWGVGALFSIASIGMYVISRTIGLPDQSGEQWLEWAGVVAVTSEAIALVATVLGLRRCLGCDGAWFATVLGLRLLMATRSRVSPAPTAGSAQVTGSAAASPAAASPAPAGQPT